MPQRSYKTKLKISKTMQGTSNFAGKEHSIGSKAKISTGRGKRNPIGTKKWFVHGDTAKTLRKTQNPGGLFRRGRTVKESKMKSFIEHVINEGMKTEASHPSKSDLKMIDKMYDDKGKQTSLGNQVMRRVIANVNRKAQDKINQRTARAKADSKPR